MTYYTGISIILLFPTSFFPLNENKLRQILTLFYSKKETIMKHFELVKEYKYPKGFL